MGGSLGVRAAVQWPGRALRSPQAPTLPAIPVGLIALAAAVGVVITSMGYADGRAGAGSNSATGIILYWIGQLLILVPAAARLISRRPMTTGETLAVVITVTIAEYLLKVDYKPLYFGFNDEYLHWRGTANMLQSGKLFELNYGLPVGTDYPGLEEVTAALVSATGLSIFQAGLLVSGIAHLLYICFLYFGLCAAIRSHRIAGIAVLIYFSAPALTSFNSMFVYETLALAFLGFCMVAALRSVTEQSKSDRNRWFAVAILCILATVVTHHVTSYMLTGFLVLVAIASRLAGSRNTARRFAILGAISLTAVIGWIATAARYTIQYFSPTVSGIISGLSQLTKSGSSAAPSTTSSPPTNLVIGVLAILVITLLIAFGCWQAWQRYRHHPWIAGMMIGCLGWFVDIGVRVGTPDGQELAGRAATFVYIPVSLLAALALTRLLNSGPAQRRSTAMSVIVVASIVSLLVDGLANGWPPYWERLPGPHMVAASESSVDSEEVFVSRWTLAELGPGNRMTADSGIYPVLIGLGGQNPLQDISEMYATSTWTPAVASFAAANQVQYVVTDSRLTQVVPPGGNSYFPGDTTSPTAPIPAANLSKYDNIQGVARVLAAGPINIYDLVTDGYVPQKP